ncbi:putative receptor protein kinase ZmPK1 [Actinidia eriantha]|uniref:putative receptor protein kinase ZmPK1 n=1 Tax=Actinidia eriantha TaxID=165200 RepID=UPI002590C550|nr:putative receptor protein kinase ZmPK1 [Actinidia eriantha]
MQQPFILEKFMGSSSFLIVLLALVLFPPFSLSSPRSSLSEGSSLSVERPTDVLISANGVFSAGFYPVGDNAYTFAIWFTKPLPDGNDTLVWLANRDQPVNGKLSKLSLLKDGNLVLTDAGRSIFWATNTISSSSMQLLLHNTGNLILRTSNGTVLWQSFDSPTDTLLPGQPLTRRTQLISSRSRSNYSSGLYKLFFDDDNVLRLIFDGPETSSIYWPDPWLTADEAGRSKYNDTRIAAFDDSGHFLSSDHLEFRAADFGTEPRRRLVLDFDGNFRLYSFEEQTGDWVVSWQANSKACRIHGACGLNGMCRYNAGSGRKCLCLPGFRMKDPTDWSHGCEPEIELSCNHNEFTFIKLSNADFFGYNINILKNYTLERCMETCLNSCDCKGFHHRFNASSGVYDCNPKWTLRNGHWSLSLPGDLYVKAPKTASSSDEKALEKFKLDCLGTANKQLDRIYRRRHESRLLMSLIWFACAIGCIEIVTFFLVWWFLHRNTSPDFSEAMGGGYLPAATGFRRFTYDELKQATRGFSEEVGRGGSGVVYKGLLCDGRVAAIKRLNETNRGEVDFQAEISTIGRLNHMNLIESWGYCIQGKHKLLVYEYMENGSLAQNLNNKTLDWDRRFQIALGTAKGLAYLHEECLEWVLHCDIKPQNILLDSNYQPKVADFGLSKLLNRGGGSGNNSDFSKIRGTRGYMAPEWIFNLPITSKVDVYSYGVVMLQMATGKSPTDVVLDINGHAGEMGQRTLIKWIREKVNTSVTMESWIEEIVDPVINGKYDAQEMQIVITVALKCVEEDKDARPTMTQVLEMFQHHESN